MKTVHHNSHKINVKRTCELLGISRASYYERINRQISAYEKENARLDQLILKIYRASKQIYGAPKIHNILIKQGENCSLKRVQKRMRQLGIRSKTIKKWKPTSTNKGKVEARNNVLKQDFTTSTINEKWVTDITYIHTVRDGWCYLSSIMDLRTRKIIAWDFGKKMETCLVLDTLNRAVQLSGTGQSLILHSDLGSQYTSAEYEKRLKALNIQHSFSKKRCPYDNAGIESFHATIKKEEVYQTTYANFEHAKIRIFEYIEGFYNRNRIHGSICYLTPVEKETQALLS